MADLLAHELEIFLRNDARGICDHMERDELAFYAINMAIEVQRRRSIDRIHAQDPVLTSHSEDEKQVRHTLETLRPVYATTMAIIERWMAQRNAGRPVLTEDERDDLCALHDRLLGLGDEQRAQRSALSKLLAFHGIV